MIRRFRCNARKLSMKGLTLIELILVVAVLSIVTAYAYPAYIEHIIRSHRTVALTDLAKIQLEIESRYDYSNGDYISAASGVITSGTCTFCNTDTQRYALAISASSDSYTIQAIPKAEQKKDSCLDSTNDILQLHQSGLTSPLSCWH